MKSTLVSFLRHALVGLSAVAVWQTTASGQVYSLTYTGIQPQSAMQIYSTNGTATANVNTYVGVQTYLSGPTSFELFCIELSQNTPAPNVAQNYTFVSSIEGAPLPGSGNMDIYPGVISANGGMGLAAAERVSKLYGYVFGGTDASFYNVSSVLNTNDKKAAFQLAVWELSHDDDFSLTDPDPLGTAVVPIPALYVTATGGSVTQATTWLSYVQTNLATIAPMSLGVFTSPTLQDIIVPTRDGAPIPEPSTYAAILSALTLGFVVSRRRRQLV